MARVAALIPDLLFGSKVQGALRAAGHDVELVSGAEAVGDVEVVVVDLTADGVDPGELVRALAGGEARTLGFFAHVQPEVRERALAAGFDQVVPRSRMAREGADLVARLTRTA
ncbi:MAG: hypothetical protein QOG35_1512 [Solirubrobacteraceae bacterium]|jgi:CheY-like chemotaxis protein|nr:hypothetical protein [Solirubrobacteraceae bacterium]